MNKVMLAAIVATGLSAGVSAEAETYTEVRSSYDRPAYSDRGRRSHSRDYYERRDYRRDYYQHKRGKHMPRWLKRKSSFRRWYRDSPIARYRFLSWNQLYEIYRWESSYFRHHRHY